MKKKNIVKHNKGILGTGTDYAYYSMTVKEKVMVSVASILAGTLAFGLFFKISLFAVIFGVIVAVVMQSP